MPRLSVIVTTYNIEKYVEQAVRSVCRQTLDDIEIIVVDDGSTDSTPAVLSRLAAGDERIKLRLRGQNSIGGVATAANAGLDMASGQYVGFMDGDDYCDPTMFAKLLEAAETHHAEMAMCQYRLVDEVSGEETWPADQNRWNAFDHRVLRLGTTEREQLLRFVAVPWRKIYLRKFLDSNNLRFPVVDYFYEDNPFHWFCILSARTLVLVPEALCYHRMARVGQTMSTADARLFRMFEHAQTIRSWLSEHDLGDQYAGSLIVWVVSQFEWISQRTPPSLRAQLVSAVQPALQPYSDPTIEAALVHAGKGRRARALAAAARAGNVAEVALILDRWGRPGNPAIGAAYHLRYSGMRETAIRTVNRVRTRRDEAPPPDLEEIRPTFSNRDIVVALTLIEHRLTALEDAVAGRRSERTGLG